MAGTRRVSQARCALWRGLALVLAISGAVQAQAATEGFLVAKTVALTGGAQHRASDLALDAAGNAYVAGIVGSYDFPGLDSARYTNAAIGQRFVVRLDALASTPAYVVAVGAPSAGPRDAAPGLARDGVTGLAVDSAGNAYVVAYASALRYPLTGGDYVPVLPAKYVYRVSPAGDVARFSAALDPAIRRVGAIAVDASGAIYLTGSATDGLRTTAGAAFATASVAAGCVAPYVQKLDATGQAVVWATYLGVAGIAGQTCGGRGSEPNLDPTGFALVLDGTGNVYLTGQAEPGLAATAGAVNTAPTLALAEIGHGPAYMSASHAFVAKFGAAGALQWVARLGGEEHDRGTGIAVDATGHVYVGGKTGSRTFVFAGAFGNAYPYAFNDCMVATPEVGFVAKLTPDGARLALSGFVPAAGDALDRCTFEGPMAPLLPDTDESGNVVLFGTTSPTERDPRPTPDALEPVPDGRSLLEVVAADGSVVRYATSFAGTGIYGVARDAWGNWVTVDRQAIVRTLSPQLRPVLLDVAPPRGCAGQPLTLDARVAAGFDQGRVTFSVDGIAAGTVTAAGGVARLAVTLAPGVHRLHARYDGGGLFDGYGSLVRLVAVDQAGACA